MTSTEERVLAATPGPRPEWGRSGGGMSTLVAVAQGELALRAAARVLDEHAARAGMQVVEVARVRTADQKHEGVYARCVPLGEVQEQPQPTAENVTAVQSLGAQVDQMTDELSQAVLGVRP